MPIVLNGSGPVTGVTSLNTTVSDTEIGFLDGVTSALQSQINTKPTGGTGAWTSFTPTLSGGTWAAGNGTFSAAWTQIGKTVFYRGTFTFGSTTVTSGVDALRISLPVATFTAAMPPGGTCTLLDSGIANYHATLGFASTTTFAPQVTSATVGQISGLVTSSPFTWAANDIIRWQFFYEAE